MGSFSVSASLSSLHRKTLPQILPQNEGKPTEIQSNLSPAEFAKFSGLKETSFTWKEVSESEIKLSKNAQTITLNKSPRDKTKKKKTKKKVPTTLIQDAPLKVAMPKRAEKTKTPTEKPQEHSSNKPPEKVADRITNLTKNVEPNKKENQPPITKKAVKESVNEINKFIKDQMGRSEKNSTPEIRKSPRIKKRPADDTGKKSSRKSQPKKRKTRTPADLLKSMQFSDDEN